MKKFVTVLFVLLMVSYSQAGLILTVNGNAAPAGPVEITQGDTSAVLGMAIEAGSDVMYYHVAMSITSGAGTFDTGSFTWVTSMRDQSYSFDTNKKALVDAAQNIIFDLPVGGPKQLFTVKVDFPDPFSQVDVKLVVTDNTMVSGSVITPPTEIGSVSFVPEPASLVLLAVGGILLQRKRMVH